MGIGVEVAGGVDVAVAVAAVTFGVLVGPCTRGFAEHPVIIKINTK
jgi:hypothetical protein